ncbi:MAG: hypothetical protein ACL93V_15740 [Candidatus Electrothrix sp. YB6]
MLNWDEYSLHDLVALEQREEHVKYMTKTLTAFKAVEQLYALKKEREQEAVTEHDIVLTFLRKLSYTFDLLRIKYLFNSSDSLKIDKSDSGFVNFYEIAQLETDLLRQNEQAPEDKGQELKEQILSSLLEKRKEPEELLARMADNVYRRGLIRENLFLFFNEGQLIPLQTGDRKKRRYLYYWACYDKLSNRPYIYLLDFKQDRDEPPLRQKKQEAFDRFMEVIRSEGARAPAVGIVAMAIDQRLESVHPKMLKRICIGPIYSQSFSVNLPEETEQLFAAGDEGRKFVFHLTEQFVFSAGQTVIKDQQALGNILTGERVRERFYIPKPTDVDEYSVFNELEAQKASLIRKIAIMPYKLHQHVHGFYKGYKIISFSKDGIINGL